jgi:hypothetical protein
MTDDDMKVWNDFWISTHGALEDFCKLVAARAAAVEREACALIAESYEPICDRCPRGVATAIRARKDT